MRNHYLFLCLLLASFSCQSAGKAEVENDGADIEQLEESNAVTVMTLERRAFEHETVSNGKVQALRFADLTKFIYSLYDFYNKHYIMY